MQNVTILKEFEEFGQQSKNSYGENKRLEKIVILKDPNSNLEGSKLGLLNQVFQVTESNELKIFNTEP